MVKNFFISIPHSGENIPPEASWLQDLEEKTLLCDVDRYVDKLYQKAIKELHISHIISKWHRYAADLNRSANEIDEYSVQRLPHEALGVSLKDFSLPLKSVKKKT